MNIQEIVNDKELYDELVKAYELAAPYTAHARFAIAYLQRPELVWSNAYVYDSAKGEMVIHAHYEIIIPELQSKG